MKRIRCPKCGTPIQFDETLYETGRILVFECPDCYKQFRIRMPQKKMFPSPQPCAAFSGKLIVLENDFQLRQEISLEEGDNVVGKFVNGTRANAAFKTVDPSIDPVHCIVTVHFHEGVPLVYLKDESSNTGTFLMNEILRKRERIRIDDGAVINIGAATLILHL